LGIKGLEALTSKADSKEWLNVRVQVRAMIGLSEMFLRVISTWGPPGLNGAIGPMNDTTSTGWLTGEEWNVGKVADGEVVLETEQPAASIAASTATKVNMTNIFFIFLLIPVHRIKIKLS